MFDRGAQPAKAARRDERTTACGRWRSGCRGRVEGIDPQRTCDACRGAGHPTRVPWEEAKATTGTTWPELVMEPLKNAALLTGAAPAEAESARDDVAAFGEVA